MKRFIEGVDRDQSTLFTHKYTLNTDAGQASQTAPNRPVFLYPTDTPLLRNIERVGTP